MINPTVSVETTVINIEQKVEHGLESVAAFALKVKHVIAEVVKDEPEIEQLKVTLKGCAVDGAAIAAELAAVIAARGSNWTADEDLVGKVQNFIMGRIAGELIPEVEKLNSDLEAGLKA